MHQWVLMSWSGEHICADEYKFPSRHLLLMSFIPSNGFASSNASISFCLHDRKMRFISCDKFLLRLWFSVYFAMFFSANIREHDNNNNSNAFWSKYTIHMHLFQFYRIKTMTVTYAVVYRYFPIVTHIFIYIFLFSIFFYRRSLLCDLKWKRQKNKPTRSDKMNVRNQNTEHR